MEQLQYLQVSILEDELIMYKQFTCNIQKILGLDNLVQSTNLEKIFDQTKDVFISLQRQIDKQNVGTRSYIRFPSPTLVQNYKVSHMLFSTQDCEDIGDYSGDDSTEQASPLTMQSMPLQTFIQQSVLENSAKQIPLFKHRQNIRKLKINQQTKQIYITRRQNIQFFSEGEFVSVMRGLIQKGAKIADCGQNFMARAALMLRLLPPSQISLSNNKFVAFNKKNIKDLANKIDKDFKGFMCKFDNKEIDWKCGEQNYCNLNYIKIYDYNEQ
ncbi:hypothetical protein SS50377_22408 [Spironucleus salmonicida]|uniref:Uncharacterized protein n=1 Tax=Spironucleus salmonicida TaxID=348837 RepID=V6LCW9_9EUKA|nr:hypothetical protein SS50377_22408 [Spironucleus salmonicida]|eukprot:EST42098.1 Hypothetical protein SS50377_18407 [Spironucleus salmonicida]